MPYQQAADHLLEQEILRPRLPQLIPRFKVNVDEEVITKGESEVEALVERLQLKRQETPYDPHLDPHCTLDKDTIQNYKNLWAEMRKFFFLVGCYQSAMLCDRVRCPENPLPFKRDSFRLYLAYRFGVQGDPLVHPGTNENVKDINGENVYVLGGWESPSSCYKISGAVNFLHNHYVSCQGPYVSNCPECEQQNPDLGSLLQETTVEDTEANDRPITHPVDVINFAIAQQPNDDTYGTLKTRLLGSLRDPREAGAIMELLRSVVTSEVQRARAELISTAHHAQQAVQQAPVPPTPTARPRKRSRTATEGGGVELDGTKTYGKLSGVARLEFLIAKEKELQDKVGGEKEKLTDACKRFYNRHVPKVLKCYRGCFNSDKAAFVESYGSNFSTSNFKCTCGNATASL